MGYDNNIFYINLFKDTMLYDIIDRMFEIWLHPTPPTSFMKWRQLKWLALKKWYYFIQYPGIRTDVFNWRHHYITLSILKLQLLVRWLLNILLERLFKGSHVIWKKVKKPWTYFRWQPEQSKGSSSTAWVAFVLWVSEWYIQRISIMVHWNYET